MTYTDDAERVIAMYGTIVYRVCRVKLASADPSLADDAYQNTFLYWIEHPPKIAPSSEHEKAWFIRCAVHRCTDLLRKRDVHEEIPETLPAPDDDATEVMQALLTLPEKYRMPLYLTAVMGYSCAETAKILGMTAAGVRMRLTRARRALAAVLELEEYLPDTEKEENI
ncbi:MAG: RNA polymerase sigma factor [Clostridia bacterium]|nr:RNA polymerase sigma factor [Clostridia bacterium]